MRSRQLMALAVVAFAIGCSGIPDERQGSKSATALQAGPDDYVLAVPGMH